MTAETVLFTGWAVINCITSYQLAAAWQRLNEARNRLTESQVAHLNEAKEAHETH